MVKAIINLTLSILILTSVSFAQEENTGNWSAKIKEKKSEKLYLQFKRESSNAKSGKRYTYQHGSFFEYNRLDGLSESQVRSGGPVSFSITAEAGTIQLTGSFTDKKGKGTYVFTPNESFRSEVDRMGLGRVNDKKLFSATVLDLKLARVDELRNAGLEVNEFEDLVKATIFKVDGDYVAEMQGAGFEGLELEDLVKTRIFKIDSAYASEVNAMGFQDMSVEKLVKFRIFKVTPDFLKEVREMGFNSPSPEEVVKMRIFKIDLDFVRELEKQGHSNLSLKELIDHRIGIKKLEKTF